MSVNISNAINASINQQRITRGYYYNIVQNDSKLPTLNILQSVINEGVERVGMFALGWRQKAESELQLAPCYKLLPLSNDIEEEECSPGRKDGQPTTQFVRVKTTFGVCSTSYVANGNHFYEANNIPSLPTSAAVGSCLNTQ